MTWPLISAVVEEEEEDVEEGIEEQEEGEQEGENENGDDKEKKYELILRHLENKNYFSLIQISSFRKLFFILSYFSYCII